MSQPATAAASASDAVMTLVILLGQAGHGRLTKDGMRPKIPMGRRDLRASSSKTWAEFSPTLGVPRGKPRHCAPATDLCLSMPRVLTGITTTGTPHLGNYVGAIRPALALAGRSDVQAFYFLADYHALIKCQDAERVQRSTLEIAATWLALGLDPERVYFYRQSDIPEITELTWLLTCVAGKGLLNRAHAYKASVDANLEQQLDADAGVTMGLFNYPILMAADILMFGSQLVPVGRDQVQHIEIARDIAQRFNHLYQRDWLTLPEAVLDDAMATLPGLDGRKMSKSYDNAIALFQPPNALRKQIMRIVTNSQAPGEAKDPDQSHLYTLYSAFANQAERAQMRQAFADGIAWGEAKQALVDLLERALAPARQRYDELMRHPGRVEECLQYGASKARTLSAPFMRELKSAVGLRALSAPAAPSTAAEAIPAAPGARPARKSGKAPRLVEFQGKDGKYYFKLLAGAGSVLYSSPGFPDEATRTAQKPAWSDQFDEQEAAELAARLGKV